MPLLGAGQCQLWVLESTIKWLLVLDSAIVWRWTVPLVLESTMSFFSWCWKVSFVDVGWCWTVPFVGAGECHLLMLVGAGQCHKLVLDSAISAAGKCN